MESTSNATVACSDGFFEAATMCQDCERRLEGQTDVDFSNSKLAPEAAFASSDQVANLDFPTAADGKTSETPPLPPQGNTAPLSGTNTPPDEPASSYAYDAEQQATLNEIESHLSEFIKVGHFFDSNKTLRNIINNYGSKKGFKVSIQSSSIKCCLSSAPKGNATKRQKYRKENPNAEVRCRTSRRVGCGFVIKFTDASKQTGEKGSIRITAADLKHSNGCFPSLEKNVVMRAGDGVATTNWAPEASDFSSTDQVAHLSLRNVAANNKPGEQPPLPPQQKITASLSGTNTPPGEPASSFAYDAEHQATIEEIKSHLSEFIKVGQLFDSNKSLRDIVNNYGSKKGFKVAIQSSSIRCCLASAPKGHATKKKKFREENPTANVRCRSSHRVGCGFVVKFTDASKQTGGKGSIRITATDLKHSNGCCFPSIENLVVVRAGDDVATTDGAPVAGDVASSEQVADLDFPNDDDDKTSEEPAVPPQQINDPLSGTIAPTDDLSSSYAYDAEQQTTLDEIDSHLSEFIKVGYVFDSNKSLRDIVNNYGSKKGFKVSIQSSSIKCCLASAPKGTATQKKKFREENPNANVRCRFSHRVGCGFVIKFTDASKQTGKKGSIRVTKADLKHSNGCYPSRENLIMVNKRSGHYVATTDWAPVVKLLGYGEHVPAPLLRAAIEDIVPKGVVVDSTMLYNVRLKVKRILASGYDPKSGTKITFDPNSLDNT